MKRLHVHIAVDHLADSIGFYAAMFGGADVGLNHLGIQVESAAAKSSGASCCQANKRQNNER